MKYCLFWTSGFCAFSAIYQFDHGFPTYFAISCIFAIFTGGLGLMVAFTES